jgi:putative transposase
MKKRFSEEQIVRIIGESRSAGVPATAKRYAVSEHTIYLWRRKFGGLEVRQVTELKRLQQENARLKKLVAERDLELDVTRDLIAKKS